MADRVLTLKHFFEEARAGRLTGIRCGKCGELAIPPKEFCPTCQERDWTPLPLGGVGRITSFTVIRVAPLEAHTSYAPYTCFQCAEAWCMAACPVDAITIAAETEAKVVIKPFLLAP